MPNVPPEGALQRSIGYGKRTTAATRYRNKSGRPVQPLDQRIESARVRIEQEGDPIGFLMNVMKGVSVNVGREKVIPDLDQRIKAATILVNKIVPDVKPGAMDTDKPADKGGGEDDEDRGSIVERLTRRLTIITETVGERGVSQVPVEARAVAAPIPLAHLGEAEPAPTRRRKQRKDVADVVAPGGPRVREDTNGSGVGSGTGGEEVSEAD